LTLMIFAVTSVVPRLVGRLGNTRVLVGGILVSLVGMAWLSRVGAGTPYLTGVAIPMVILGLGAAFAITPMTTAGVAGVAGEAAGAASGLGTVAHQLGGSLGLGLLVTVFASALPAGSTRAGLAHAISTSLTAGTALLAAALVVVLFASRRPQQVAEVMQLPL